MTFIWRQAIGWFLFFGGSFLRFFVLAAACAAILAGPAMAEEKKAEDPNKKICKFESKSTSRMAKKVCKTRAEWKALEEQRRSDVADNLGSLEARN